MRFGAAALIRGVAVAFFSELDSGFLWKAAQRLRCAAAMRAGAALIVRLCVEAVPLLVAVEGSPRPAISRLSSAVFPSISDRCCSKRTTAAASNSVLSFLRLVEYDRLPVMATI